MTTAYGIISTPGGLHPLLLIDPCTVRRKDDMCQREIFELLIYKEWEKTSRRAPFAQPPSSRAFSSQTFQKAGQTLASLMKNSFSISLKDVIDELPSNPEENE